MFSLFLGVFEFAIIFFACDPWLFDGGGYILAMHQQSLCFEIIIGIMEVFSI